VRSDRSEIEQRKDRRRVDIENIDPTEDAAMRRFPIAGTCRRRWTTVVRSDVRGCGINHLGLAPGPDGRQRCWWGVSAPDYLLYHDEEWGRPVRDDRGMYERLTLEAFQSGLSWLTILRKRESFRAAFAGFDVRLVARFDEADRARLMADAGIVRNRAKIEAAIANAVAAAAMEDAGESLAELVWSFGSQRAAAPAVSDLAGETAESRALARELKRRGFRFVGPTTVYSTMQACGVVNDHLAGCCVREDVERERSRASR
jgi:DNA-3-methyladenine glycosylase I